MLGNKDTASMSKEEKRAYKAQLKAERKAEAEAEKAKEFKLKDWCQLKGIRAEIKNVSWLSKKDLAKNSATVLLFCFVMGLFFFGGDAVIAFILKALGMN